MAAQRIKKGLKGVGIGALRANGLLGAQGPKISLQSSQLSS